MKRLSNWEKLQQRDTTDTMQYRDVYDDQQLDRSRIGEKKSPTGRIIADVVMTLFIMILLWVSVSIIQYFLDAITGRISFNVVDGPDMVTMTHYLFRIRSFKVVLCLAVGAIFFAIMYQVLMRNLDAQNTLDDVSDINQYPNDQHIALPEELQVKFDWFPDVGATSDVQFSSMISHMALSNKGLKKIQVAKRAQSDILDEDGEIVVYKGEVLRDDNGNPIMEEKPLIDTRFMEALYEASGLRDKKLRQYYDTTVIPYNPDGKNREKLGKFATVADLINKDWQLPWYEPQRPAGAYLVDTAPCKCRAFRVNLMTQRCA